MLSKYGERRNESVSRLKGMNIAELITDSSSSVAKTLGMN